MNIEKIKELLTCSYCCRQQKKNEFFYEIKDEDDEKFSYNLCMKCFGKEYKTKEEPFVTDNDLLCKDQQ